MISNKLLSASRSPCSALEGRASRQRKQRGVFIKASSGNNPESRAAEARAWISAWRTKQLGQQANVAAELTGDVLAKAIEFQLRRAAETKKKKVNPAREVDQTDMSGASLRKAIGTQLTRAAKQKTRTLNPAVLGFTEVQTEVLSQAIETQLRRAAQTAALKTNAAVQWATLGEAELAKAIANQLKQAAERQVAKANKTAQANAKGSGVAPVESAPSSRGGNVNDAMAAVQLDELALAKAIEWQLKQVEEVHAASQQVMSELVERVGVMDDGMQAAALKRQTELGSAGVVADNGAVDVAVDVAVEVSDNGASSNGSTSNGAQPTEPEHVAEVAPDSPYGPCETYDDGSVMYTSAALEAVAYEDVIQQ